MRIADRSVLVRPAKRTLLTELSCMAMLAVLMTVVWCKVYDVNSFASVAVPRAYQGDGILGLTWIKAYRDGDVTPWTFQTVKALDAPFEASWNDFPNSEKMLPYCIGIAARLFGLIPSYNLAGLLAIILAAASFYAACRMLKYDWVFSFVGASLFGFAHYMTARFLHHLSLNYYWHIPLFLIVTWWCFDAKELPIKSGRGRFAVAIGILTGLQAIYYAFIFWQFLAFALLMHGLRRNRQKLISILLIMTASMGATSVIAVPQLLFRFLHGSNPAAAQRSLGHLQYYGMQLPELFLPSYHRWKLLFQFAQTHYFQVTTLPGELGFCYIGILGVLGFLWLMGTGVVRLLRGNPQLIPVMFWQSIWILIFSLVGGVNLLFGVFGLQLFRVTSRFSIVLLCLALFFLVKQLGRRCPRTLRPLLAAILLLFGFWDTLPPFSSEAAIIPVQQEVQSDADFVHNLEQKVGAGTMVFEIPVMDFPEVLPRLGVTDYTFFRPYLYSKTLRFSYGADKGRPLEAWQHDVDVDPPSVMARELEKYGFGILLVDRKGYADGARSLITALETSGHSVLQQDAAGEFVAIALRPAAKPVLPEIPPFPGKGFYGWEGDWRKGALTWSSGNANLIFTNPSKTIVQNRCTFILGSLSRRSVTVVTPDGETTVELGPTSNKSVGPLSLKLAPGETPVQFLTDAPAVGTGSQDPRLLAFSVALQPKPSNEPEPILKTGFYGWEGDWQNGSHSWSQGDATLVLNNLLPYGILREYSFILNSTTPRHVTVATPEESQSIELAPEKPVKLGPFRLRLLPGPTTIHFKTDRPAVMAGAGDPRKITFSMALLPGPEMSQQ